MSVAPTSAASCKVPEETCWEVLQDVELLKYRPLPNAIGCAILDLFYLFPKLLDLEIYDYLFYNVNFHSRSSACALLRLEIHDSHFYVNDFKNLVQMCPVLEVVKMYDCDGIYLYHLQYLIGHATNLQILHCDVIRIDVVLDSIAITRQNATKGNPSMRCLHLHLPELYVDEDEEDYSRIIYESVCCILKQCPNVEEICLDGFRYKNVPFVQFSFADIISTLASCATIVIEAYGIVQ